VAARAVSGPLVRIPLLVIGSGPYGLAVAARALGCGIETRVVGRLMGFWRENMPEGMLLRSGPDWHLDASEVHTFEAFLEDAGIAVADVDPVPISVFLEYAVWFQAHKGIVVDDRMVRVLMRSDDGFRVQLDDETELVAQWVVAAPGNGYFYHLPDWAATLPDGIGAHTSATVEFDDADGARVLIVGGRQSAYEWAALFGDHGAARVDIVHRHEIPRFERVSWKFVDECVDSTVRVPGWWHSLSQAQQDEIAATFWKVGRSTLEWWLTPRIAGPRFHRWPGSSVVDTRTPRNGTTTVMLSSGDRLEVDRVVFATGYKTDIARVPYLQALLPQITTFDGFPTLDERFQSSVRGLYLPGFVSTRDFGPFFGFTKGCPAAATIIVDHLLAHG